MVLRWDWLMSIATGAPVFTRVSATTGVISSQVPITGSGFGARQNGSLANLNDAPVTMDSWEDTTALITVLVGAKSGYMAVSLAARMNNSNPVYFTVTDQPLSAPISAAYPTQPCALTAYYGRSSFGFHKAVIRT